MNVATPAHQRLRTETATDHATVDRLFGRFALDDVESYGRFLTAHARCVLPLERAVSGRARDGMAPRGPLLLEDLAALGLSAPLPADLPSLGDEVAMWGVSYVLEGSRLGGAYLRRQVPEAFPAAYLGAVHPSGHWRAFLETLDSALPNERSVARAVHMAKQIFAMFAEAAEREVARGRC